MKNLIRNNDSVYLFFKKIQYLLKTAALWRSSEVRRFYFLNSKFWKKMGAKDNGGTHYVLIEMLYRNPWFNALIAINAAILAYIFKAKCIALVKNRYSRYNWMCWFLESFVDVEYAVLPLVSKSTGKNIDAITNDLFKSIRNHEDVLRLTYDGIFIGDYVYDSYVRVHDYATLTNIDDKVKYEVRRAVEAIEVIRYLKDKYPIKASIFTHPIRVYDGVIAKACVHFGIPFFHNYGGIKTLRFYKNVYPHGRFGTVFKVPVDVYNELIDKYKKENLLRLANNYLHSRHSGKENDEASSFAFSENNKLFARDQFCKEFNLDAKKPIVFVMLHELLDSPHHYVMDVFNDYVDWTKFTVENILKNDEINWVLKDHPGFDKKPLDFDLPEYVKQKTSGKDNIVFLEYNYPLHSKTILQCAHAIVTCNGTAGMEFTIYGMPCIYSSESHYSDFGIGHRGRTREEYAHLLKNIIYAEKPGNEQRENAKILLFLIHDIIYIDQYEGIMKFQVRHITRKLPLKAVLKELLDAIGKNDTQIASMTEQLKAFVDKNMKRDGVEFLHIDVESRMKKIYDKSLLEV